MTTSSVEALAVTNRDPTLEAKAARLASNVLYEYHTSGRFADAVNRALSRATQPVVIKVDDGDRYPSDHARILDDWEPGMLLYGVCDWVGCDGRLIRRAPSLCASAFPSSVRVYGRQVTGSILAQTSIRTVETGVVKRVCPAEWNWGVFPWRVDCGDI